MEVKKYKWNFDRLGALLVALGNVIVTIFILLKVGASELSDKPYSMIS